MGGVWIKDQLAVGQGFGQLSGSVNVDGGIVAALPDRDGKGRGGYLKFSCHFCDCGSPVGK